MKLRFPTFSLLIILVLCTLTSWAQKPIPTTTELLFHDAEVQLILRGKVQRIFGDNDINCQATILIDEIYRGEYSLDTVSVFTGPGQKGNIPNSRCLEIGDIVVLFASKNLHSRANSYVPYTAFDRDNHSFLVPRDSTKEIDSQISNKLEILEQFSRLKDVKEKQVVQLTNAQGIIFAEGEWENGVPNGKWEHYADLKERYGQVRSTVIYNKGMIKEKKTSSWLFRYNDQEQIVLEQFYKKKNNKKYLKTEVTFEYDILNSVVSTSKNFSYDGKLQSVRTNRIFYSLFDSRSASIRNDYALLVEYSSQKKEEGYYFHGARTGVWRTYSKQGELIEEKDYGVAPMSEEGWYIAYWDEGTIRIKGQIDDQERRAGKWELFYEDGSLQELGFFEEGQKTGTWLTYSERGILINERHYRSGQLQDSYLRYDIADGRLITKGGYLNGRKVGIWKSYELGQLLVKKYNDQGQLHGKSTTYSLAGEIANDRTYNNGLLNGWSRHYHDDGTVREEQEYRDGFPIGPLNTYDRLGRLTMRNEYLPDFFTGKKQMKTFNPERQVSLPRPTLNQEKTVEILGTSQDSIEISGAGVDQSVKIFGNSLFSAHYNGLLRVDVTAKMLAAYSTPWPDSLLYQPSQHPPQMAFYNDTLSCLFKGRHLSMSNKFDVFRFYKKELISVDQFPIGTDRGRKSRIANDGESLISYHQMNYDIRIEKYNMRRQRVTSTSPPIPDHPQEKTNWYNTSFDVNNEFAFFSFQAPKSTILYVGIESLKTGAFEHFQFEVPRMLAEKWTTTKVEYHNNTIYLLGHHIDPDSRKNIRGMYALNCATKQVDYLEWQDKLASDGTYIPQNSKVRTYFDQDKMFIVFNYDANGIKKQRSPFRNIILEINMKTLEFSKRLDAGSNHTKQYFLVDGYWIEYLHYKPAIGQQQGRSVFKRFELAQ